MAFPVSPHGREQQSPLPKQGAGKTKTIATTNSERVYNYVLISFESVLTVGSVYPRKGQLDSVSMVALTPGTVCHQTITFLTLEKKVCLPPEYSQKSGQRERLWLRLSPVSLGQRGNLLAHVAEKARAQWDLPGLKTVLSETCLSVALSSAFL